MKKVFLLAATAFILMAANAQFVSVPTRVNTPYGAATFNTPVYTGPGFRYYGRSNPNANAKYEVVLKNDSLVAGKGTIEEKKEKFSLKIKSKSDKSFFVPNETKSVTRILTDKEKIEGIPYKDSCWIFKTIKGKINGYSLSSDPSMAYLFAIEQGNEIVPVSKDLVLKLVAGNDKAEKQAKKGYYTKAVITFNDPESENKKTAEKNTKVDNVYD